MSYLSKHFPLNVQHPIVRENVKLKLNIRSVLNIIFFNRCLNKKGERDLHLYWDFERNSEVNPLLLKLDNKKYWFICPINPCGCHRYETTAALFYQKKRCPYCTGHRICLHNSAWYKIPNLFLHWNFEKNIVDPKAISPYSTTKVWLRGKSKSIILENFFTRGSHLPLAWDFAINVTDPLERKEGERYWFKCVKDDCHRYWITFDQFLLRKNCILCEKRIFTRFMNFEVPTRLLM